MRLSIGRNNYHNIYYADIFFDIYNLGDYYNKVLMGNKYCQFLDVAALADGDAPCADANKMQILSGAQEQ